MKAVIRPMELEDIGIVTNYLQEEAETHVTQLPDNSVLSSLELVLGKDNGYVVMLGDLLIGFVLWEIRQSENWLTTLFVAPAYRTRKDVVIPLYKKFYKALKDNVIRYTPLHQQIDSIRFCHNGVIDRDGLKSYIER